MEICHAVTVYYLSADDPGVALCVEKVVEPGLVLVGGAAIVVDGVEVVHPHLVGLMKKRMTIT